LDSGFVTATFWKAKHVRDGSVVERVFEIGCRFLDTITLDGLLMRGGFAPDPQVK
jgi:hypothetical protein